VRWGRAQAGQKQEKLVSQHKDSLTSVALLHMQAKKNKEFINYFPWAGSCLAASWKTWPQHT